MTHWIKLVLSLASDVGRCRRGATAIEYGLIVSLVVVVAMVGVSTVGGGAGHLWGTIRDKVNSVEP